MSGISTKITVIDGMSGALNAMYRGVSQLVSGMEQAQRASKNAIDISAFQEAQRSMAESVSQMRLMESEAKRVQDANKQIETTAKNMQQAYQWQNINPMEVFNTSGIERYRREIGSLNSLAESMRANQQAIGSSMMDNLYDGIYPRVNSEGFTDINNINNRIANLHNSLGSISSIDTTGYTAANQSRMNAEIETLRAYEQEILNVQASLKQNMSDGNMSGVNADIAKLNSLSEQLEERMRQVFTTVQDISNVSWNNFNNVEIFNSSGLERAEQEINSLRVAYDNIESAQNTITNNALAMRLLPTNAATDINNLNARISNLSTVIANMESQRNRLSKWDTAGINRYNSEIEDMRMVMSRIESIQNDINRAVATNDINRVNAGYNRLNSIVNSVENSIRSNTTEQNRFNSALSTGSNMASQMVNNLTSGIRSYITMAATAFGGKQFIEASDISIGNNARLGLITDDLAEQKALQQQIYQSAKNSRSIYSDTVDTVAKLGLLAGDAFNNNMETTKFSELMQKSFALSGANTQEKQSAMYQLAQAMAAGKLQGDEFRSIMENAPMLAQAIADFTGKSKGELKEMSSEGTITADVIKGALFSAADDIEEKYAQMPMRFSDAWNGIVSDAQMAFQPVFEMMNNALNSDMGQSYLTSIAANLQWLAQQAQETGNWLSSIAIQAEPGLAQLGSTVRGIITQFLGVNGVVNQVARNLVSAFNSGGASSLRVYANAVGNIAISLSNVLNVMGPLLPYVTSLYVGFKTYQTVTGFISPIISAVQELYQVYNSATTAIQGATQATRIFNTVSAANVFVGIASAILGIAAAWQSVGDNAKYAAKAQTVATNADAAYQTGIDNIAAGKYAKNHNVDINTAKMILASKNDYDEQIAAILAKVEEERYSTKTYTDLQLENLNAAEKNAIASKNPVTAIEYMGDDINPTMGGVIYQVKFDNAKIQGSDYQKNRADANIQVVELQKQRAEREQEYIELANKAAKEIDDIDKENSTIDNIGNVDNVNHINDTVDIASEDLRYMRDLAEQETINQFTSKLLQPAITVNIGEIKETADVDGIIGRLTEGLAESLNNSSDLVHI